RRQAPLGRGARSGVYSRVLRRRRRRALVGGRPAELPTRTTPRLEAHSAPSPMSIIPEERREAAGGRRNFDRPVYGARRGDKKKEPPSQRPGTPRYRANAQQLHTAEEM